MFVRISDETIINLNKIVEIDTDKSKPKIHIFDSYGDGYTVEEQYRSQFMNALALFNESVIVSFFDEIGTGKNLIEFCTEKE